MNDRLKYFDILRGIAIVGVVAIHSFNSVRPHAENLFFTEILFYRQILNFSVPLFLAISGYFLYTKEINDKIQYFNFLKKQVPRAYFPCLIWSCVFLIFNVYRGSSIHWEIFKALTFQSAGPYYFILLIIQYYLLLPLLKRMATVRGLAIAAVISIIACLSILYVKYYIHYNIPLLLYAGLFPTWLVFFVEGLYLKNNSIKINVKKMALFFVFVGILLSIAETYYWYGKYRDFGNSITAVKLSSFFFSFFLVLYLLSSSKNQINSKILVFLGNASFGIYLMHMLFLPIVESCLNKIFPKIASIQLVYQPLSISLTIFLCLFTRYAAKKLNSNFSSKYLGL